MRGARRSSWWSRAADWLIAAWAVVALVTPVALPTMVAHAAPAAAMPCDVAMHRQAAGARHPAGDQRAHDHGNDHACCTCFGPCCHAAPAVFARAPQAPHLTVARVFLPAPAPAVRVRYYPTAPEHARPPSVGPPVGLPV